MRALLPSLACLLLLAACERGTPDRDPTTAVAATPRMVEGVQVVDVEVGVDGFVPDRIALDAGVPARLVFTRRVEGECASQVQIPELGVPRTDLPMDEPVAVTFTPEEDGEFTFLCGMEMMWGTIGVSEGSIPPDAVR